MRRKKLLWQLYPTYLLIIIVSLLAVGWYTLSSVRQLYFTQKRIDLEALATLVRNQVTNQEPFSLESGCNLLAKNLGPRITLINPSGRVVCDSKRDAARLDNHADRPEFKKALAEGIGSSTRFSNSLNENLLYLAIPVENHGQVIGVARASVPVTSIDQTLHSIQIKIAFGGLVIALMAAVISLFIVRRISRPLEDLKKGAERFAAGDFKHKVDVPYSEEIGRLAKALNQMAEQLNDKIQTIITQRNEKEAILSSMSEGVLAVDAEERIISLNKSAAKLLQINPKESRGKYVLNVVRNVSLQKFISGVLSGNNETDNDIVLSLGDERSIQLRGAMLYDAWDQGIGALIVLNDVTRLRRLENTRREFVANVSHELKTPITSIKGFIETLLVKDIQDPYKHKEFLEIVFKQADRLNAIIEDLLSLSRIEQESEKGRFHLEETRLKEVLQNAILNCDPKALEKDVKIKLVCEDELITKANPPLLEQAVTNLIENAIKYSFPKSAIEVKSVKSNSKVDIRVRDWGCGISQDHLPRLFERFYRVDPARSRKLGGTGLGLAIVKHIAQAHGGSISVKSVPDKGSIFFIHLPEPNPL